MDDLFNQDEFVDLVLNQTRLDAPKRSRAKEANAEKATARDQEGRIKRALIAAGVRSLRIKRSTAQKSMQWECVLGQGYSRSAATYDELAKLVDEWLTPQYTHVTNNMPIPGYAQQVHIPGTAYAVTAWIGPGKRVYSTAPLNIDELRYVHHQVGGSR